MKRIDIAQCTKYIIHEKLPTIEGFNISTRTIRAIPAQFLFLYRQNVILQKCYIHLYIIFIFEHILLSFQQVFREMSYFYYLFIRYLSP